MPINVICKSIILQNLLLSHNPLMIIHPKCLNKLVSNGIMLHPICLIITKLVIPINSSLGALNFLSFFGLRLTFSESVKIK